VIGEDGRRLAKRHGDTRIATYREAGVPAERVIALLARWLGMEQLSNPVSAASLLDSFDLDRIPKQPVVFAERDDHFLRRG
jgi:glutamyl-tRNA synthetase